jgi:hypothetical protein
MIRIIYARTHPPSYEYEIMITKVDRSWIMDIRQSIKPALSSVFHPFDGRNDPKLKWPCILYKYRLNAIDGRIN